MARKKAPQLCAICGVNLGVTKDHIPAQSLYPRQARRPNQCLNYVMACSDCNNGAAQNDEEFKMYILLSTGDIREDSNKIIDSMAATLSNNNRLKTTVFQAQTVQAALHTPEIKSCKAVTFDITSFNNVICQIVKALYWTETGNALGKNTEIKVFPFHAMDAEFHQAMKNMMDKLEPKFLNDKTFTYKCHIDDDGSSIWGVQFFGSPQTTTFAYATAPHQPPSS